MNYRPPTEQSTEQRTDCAGTPRAEFLVMYCPNLETCSLFQNNTSDSSDLFSDRSQKSIPHFRTLKLVHDSNIWPHQWEGPQICQCWLRNKLVSMVAALTNKAHMREHFPGGWMCISQLLLVEQNGSVWENLDRGPEYRPNTVRS